MADDDLRVPLDALPVHDPFVLPVAHDGTYRLYQGVAGDPAGVEVRHSRDLRTWSAPRRVFSVPDDAWADPRARRGRRRCTCGAAGTTS